MVRRYGTQSTTDETSNGAYKGLGAAFLVVLATSSLAARALSRSTCASSAAIPCATRCALATYSGTRESSASASASAPATSAVAHARQVHRGPRAGPSRATRQTELDCKPQTYVEGLPFPLRVL